jgi:uncharacterized protein (TIGR02453 family)
LGWEFRGLPLEGIHFLAALQFNNNKPFFEENRALYMRALREPLCVLARDMAPVMAGIDDRFELRPERVVARIYRDARYSRGIPYRDYLWLGWKPMGASAGESFSYYFYVNTRECGWGMGFYGQIREWMAAFRQRVIADPDGFLALAGSDAAATFSLEGEDYKRPPETPELPQALAPWIRKKSFYLEKTASHEACMSPDLPGRLTEDFTGLAPLYRYVNECRSGQAGEAEARRSV